MLIGLLSDTHSFLDPTIAVHFKDCDEIWHAGDIGDISVAQELEKIKPLQAVYGNIDDSEVCSRFPEDLWLTREGLTICITHIAGKPPRYSPRVKKMLAERKPGALICGHSHILQVKRDEAMNMMFINPGAAGQHGFHTMRTIIRMDLAHAKINKMEVIELGKRGVN